jgi:hypothetical protein
LRKMTVTKALACSCSFPYWRRSAPHKGRPRRAAASVCFDTCSAQCLPPRQRWNRSTCYGR